jgi:hypothetical protein
MGQKKRVNSCGLASKKTKRNKKRIATVSTTQLQCWWCVGYKPAAVDADAADAAAAAEAENNRIEEKTNKSEIAKKKKNSEKCS